MAKNDDDEIIVHRFDEVRSPPPEPKKRTFPGRWPGHLMSPYEMKVGHFLKMCPLCGGVLRVRHGRGGHRFLGCSGYPDCRYTQPS
jgi:hypothetical protein